MIYLRRLLAMQKIKIEDIGDLLSLNGDRQSFRHDVLTITREHWPPSSNLNNKIPQDVALFLRPAPFMQSDNPQIKAQQLLQQFALADWADELIEAYSHGMKQRLIIASALLHDPRILIIFNHN
jgi:ABC-type methionine transport system ATPase subunit